MSKRAINSSEWGFYGRSEQLAEVRALLQRRRWFFLKLAGRRRIGKTSLIQHALQAEGRDRALYIQIPDSDPAGVISAAREFFELFGISDGLPKDLRSLAGAIARLVRLGYVVAVDEFQYFHRKALFEFTSHLQYEVDRLAADADHVTGGLIVLGSIHTEMAALLEDRSAPLFARLTHDISLSHLDIAAVLQILREHADDSPERLLFLWNLFEGVPKYYRDAFEEGVLAADRTEVLETLFFSSSSPLRSEAESWFMRELRGRYDLVLKYVSRHPGCSQGDIVNHVRSVEPDTEKQIGGYLKVLRERYEMIEQLQPVFARPASRSGRHYIRDNFLRAWLAALATPVASIHFRPLDGLLAESDARLVDAEGHGLERLAAALHEERSRKGKGDFELTHRVRGYWDRGDTEIDLVVVNEKARRLRLVTCKRDSRRLVAHLSTFSEHVGRFLSAHPKYGPATGGWTIETVALAPRLDAASRAAIEGRGFRAMDLVDLTQGL